MQFILESYEGLAIMSTVDQERGIVVIRYPSCFADDVARLLEALEAETSLRPAVRPTNTEDHARPA